MGLRPQDNETIIATATPPGFGGLSVLRCSGLLAVKLTRQFCRFLPDNLESHRCYFGSLKDLDGVLVDEVIVTYFKKGSSFTTEETIEISCHGNPLICQKIQQLFIRSGARMADPGEFTYRAFMGGRIDLVQAESVLSLIESKSDMALQKSIGLLRGSLSDRLRAIKDDFVWVLANLEAGIDFVEEGLEVSEIPGLLGRCTEVGAKISELTDSYKSSRMIFDGIRVGILGLPNSGKSSLINALANSDVAIVTDVPGTTRDLVRATIQLNGLSFELVDTAGLRETEDPVEKIGIEKSLQAMDSFDVCLFLFAADLKFSEQYQLYEELGPKDAIKVLSKSDLDQDKMIKNKELANSLCLSIQSPTSLEAVKGALVEWARTNRVEGESVIMQRHYEFLQKALVHLRAGINLLKEQASPEFVVQEVQIALRSVMEILGEKFDDEVMDRVFKDFCIGK